MNDIPNLTTEQWIIMRLLTALVDARGPSDPWTHDQIRRTQDAMFKRLGSVFYHRAYRPITDEKRRHNALKTNMLTRVVDEMFFRTGIQRPETLPRLTPLGDEVWRTADGRAIPVSEMDADHARNALRMLLRQQRQKAFETYLASARRSIRREYDSDGKDSWETWQP